MKKIILLTLGLFFCFNLLAQDIIIKNDGIEIKAKILEISLKEIKYKKYENLNGPIISILKSDIFMIKYQDGTKEVFNKKEESNKSDNVSVTYSKVEYNKEEKERGIYHLIKVNPLLVLSGDIPIYYEHRLSNKFSVEVGLGITHMNYLSYYDFDDGEINTDRKAEIGFSFCSSLKYYPSNYTKALDEAYFGPEIRIRRYNTQLENSGSILIDPPIDESRTYYDFKLSGGYIYFANDMVFIELYGGIGLRASNLFEATAENIGSINVITKPSMVKSIGPVISAGFKLGFAF